MTQQEIENTIKSYGGFKTIEKYDEQWQGYDVYKPDEGLNEAGLPVLYFVKGEEVREATVEEALAFLESLPRE